MLISYLFLLLSFTCFKVRNNANVEQEAKIPVTNEDAPIKDSNPTQSTTPKNPAKDPTSDDDCNSQYFQFLVDSKYSKMDKKFIKGANSTIFTSSILPQNSLLIDTKTVTDKMLRTDRLRIDYNDKKENIVTRVSCG